ncbi:C2 domain-containing protein [Chytriomyces sp. MP71]|nr:C2 domain-containing protein [Chytriomyces sp. MP71]
MKAVLEAEDTIATGLAMVASTIAFGQLVYTTRNNFNPENRISLIIAASSVFQVAVSVTILSGFEYEAESLLKQVLTLVPLSIALCSAAHCYCAYKDYKHQIAFFSLHFGDSASIKFVSSLGPHDPIVMMLLFLTGIPFLFGSGFLVIYQAFGFAAAITAIGIEFVFGMHAFQFFTSPRPNVKGGTFLLQSTFSATSAILYFIALCFGPESSIFCVLMAAFAFLLNIVLYCAITIYNISPVQINEAAFEQEKSLVDSDSKIKSSVGPSARSRKETQTASKRGSLLSPDLGGSESCVSNETLCRSESVKTRNVDETPLGVIKMIIHEARNLKNVELAGVSDPYCIISIGQKEIARTKTVENSLTPRWSQTLHIPILPSMLTLDSDLLTIAIYDQNETLRDKVMGHVTPLSLIRWLKLLWRTGEEIDPTLAPTVAELTRWDPLEEDERERLLMQWGSPENPNDRDIWHKVLLDSAGRHHGDLRMSAAYVPLRTSLVNYERNELPAVCGVFTVILHAGRGFPAGSSGVSCDVILFAKEVGEGECDGKIGTTDHAHDAENPSWGFAARAYVLDYTTAMVQFSVKDANGHTTELAMTLKSIIKNMKSMNDYSAWQSVDGTDLSLNFTFKWHPVNTNYFEKESAVITSDLDPIGILRVKIVKARALLNVEIAGRKSDPYANVSIGGNEIGATLNKQNTLDPLWNETFYGVLYSKTQDISIEVWDYNNLKQDEFLGRVKLGLKDLLDSSSYHAEEDSNKNGVQVDRVGKVVKVYAPVVFEMLSNPDLRIRAVGDEEKKHGFLYFDLEFYPSLPKLSVVALSHEDSEFVERKKAEASDAIQRLLQLEVTGQRTHEETQERIDRIAEKGYLGEIEITKAYLFQIQPPCDILETHGESGCEVLCAYLMSDISDSGILRFHIMTAKDLPLKMSSYMDIQIDGTSLFTSQIRHEVAPSWNTMVDLCLRSFKHQSVSILLLEARDREKRGIDDKALYHWQGNVLDLLGRTQWVTLESVDPASNSHIQVNLAVGFLPIEASLTDTTRDNGKLYIDILSASDLEAADACGTSDPYCMVHINQELIHKTKVCKKNLNPAFNEKTSHQIRSKLHGVIKFAVHDFNLVAKHTTIGTVEFGLENIPVGELLKLSLPLEGARTGKLNIKLFFDNKPSKTRQVTADASSIQGDHMRERGLAKVVGALKDLGHKTLGRSQSMFDEATASASQAALLQEATVKNISNLDKAETTHESPPKESHELLKYLPESSTMDASTLIASSTYLPPHPSIVGTCEVALTIVEARNLLAVDTNGLADPYVKIDQFLHGKEITLFKTQVIKKTLNPVWNETVHLTVPPTKIRIVLKDKNFLASSKSLGEVEVDLASQFAKVNTFDAWLPIVLGGKGDIHIKGQISEGSTAKSKAGLFKSAHYR